MTASIDTTTIEFEPTPGSEPVTGLLLSPNRPRLLYVLAHGAGAPMTHRFMETTALDLAAAGVATFRYNFPYTEAGRNRPDPPKKLQATVRSAVACARAQLPEVPLVAGGKSMGGRMTSLAASVEPLDGVQGLVFLGFPLHAPGKPGIERAEHLKAVPVPMLFLQGTRDSLTQLDLMEAVVADLGKRATLHVIDGGDHGFHVLKRSGRTPDEVRTEVVQTIVDWAP